MVVLGSICPRFLVSNKGQGLFSFLCFSWASFSFSVSLSLSLFLMSSRPFFYYFPLFSLVCLKRKGRRIGEWSFFFFLVQDASKVVVAFWLVQIMCQKSLHKQCVIIIALQNKVK